MEDLEAPQIVAFGIPTLDYSFLVSDKSVIEKYELNIDSQRELTNDSLNLLKLECHEKQYELKKTAGGNCQVSLMIFQSLSKERYRSVMCGAIGDDENGVFVRKYIASKSIKTNFDVVSNTRTANCVIAVYKDLRTIAVTNGAGSEYSLAQCKDLERKIELALSSSVVLFEGFFVGFSYDIALPVIQKCRENGNVIALNISAVYITEHFAREFLHCWKKSDILIGNMAEFDALCKTLRLSAKSLDERLKIVQTMMLAEKDSKTKSSKLSNKDQWKKILIVTNAKEPIYCVYGDNILIELSVPPVHDSEIVDTSGAGDSFFGAFLYGLLENNPVQRCLELGCTISSRVIRRHGYEL